MGDLEKLPYLVVFTIQKEVAERLCAEKGKFNLLAAAVQFWGEPKIIFHLDKNNFSPPPAVDSAVIKITPKEFPSAIKADYYRFIKISFKQPRKTLLNNLSAGLNLKKEQIIPVLSKLDLSPSSRPQDLDIQTILNLIKHLP